MMIIFMKTMRLRKTSFNNLIRKIQIMNKTNKKRSYINRGSIQYLKPKYRQVKKETS